MRSCSIELTSTTPFSIATPNSAMNPIEAERLRFMPRIHNVAMPPTTANGTLPTTSKAGFKVPKVR